MGKNCVCDVVFNKWLLGLSVLKSFLFCFPSELPSMLPRKTDKHKLHRNAEIQPALLGKSLPLANTDNNNQRSVV
jgi:hypothetical protein